MSAARGRPVMYGDAVRWLLLRANSLELLPELPVSALEAVVTDPPYGIGFGGEAWDGGALTDAMSFQRWTTAWASAALGALKPGGWLAAFGTPRTFHRLVAGVEDAGFEVRDQLLWLYAQGVPKSPPRSDGLGSTLKPAYEPVLLARKPLGETTLDANLARHGTGALQIDAARVARREGGRGFWPANIALSHSPRCRRGRCQPDCPVALIDTEPRPGREVSRLFFASKASRQEREAGCEALPLREVAIFPRGPGAVRVVRNAHPTVKPLALMRWLTRLLCPPGGTVLDPFAGSGSTGAACVLEGRRFVGIERDGRYVPIACARLTHWAASAAQEEVLP
ncbi:MAG: DNA-methyltransferase [Solirubrobacteraceae bacterium]